MRGNVAEIFIIALLWEKLPFSMWEIAILGEKITILGGSKALSF